MFIVKRMDTANKWVQIGGEFKTEQEAKLFKNEMKRKIWDPMEIVEVKEPKKDLPN